MPTATLAGKSGSLYLGTSVRNGAPQKVFGNGGGIAGEAALPIPGDSAPADQVDSDSLTIERTSGPSNAIHVFDASNSISLPRDWFPMNALQPFEADRVLSIQHATGLFADIAQDTAFVIRRFGKDDFAATVPHGTTLRLRLQPFENTDSFRLNQPKIPLAENSMLPDAPAGEPWIHGRNDEVVGWLRPAEDWIIPGVIAGFLQFNVTNAVEKRTRAGRYEEALRPAAIDLRLSLHYRGPNHPETLIRELAVAQIQMKLGNLDRAETYINEILIRTNGLLGPLSRTYAEAASLMAQIQSAAGRQSLAESYATRAIATFAHVPFDRSDLGPIPPQPILKIAGFTITNDNAPKPVAESELQLLWLLATLYTQTGDQKRAARYYHRWLQLDDLRDPEDSQFYQEDALLELARIYELTGHSNEMNPLLVRAHTKAMAAVGAAGTPEPLSEVPAMAFAESTLGPIDRSLVAAHRLERLGDVYLLEGRASEAEPLYRKALAINENTLGSNAYAPSRVRLAEAAHKLGKDGDWRALSKLAFESGAGDAISKTREASDWIESLYGSQTPKSDAEARFEAIQLVAHDDLTQASAMAATRLRYSDAALGQLLADRQTTLANLQHTERLLAKALDRNSNARNFTAEQELRDGSVAYRDDVRRINLALAARLPDLSLFESKPIGLDDVRNSIRQGEVFLTVAPIERGTAVFAVTRTKIVSYLSPVNESSLRSEISAIRGQVDPRNLAVGGRIELGRLLQFDVSRSAQLFEELFEPIRELLGDGVDLIVVPHGILRSLPLNLLIKTKHPRQPTTMADFKSFAWFGARNAIVYLPSEGSLRWLRDRSTVARTQNVFLGIGDPLLPDHPSLHPSFVEETGAALSNMWGKVSGAFDFLGCGNLPSIPETADELAYLNSTLAGGSGTLWLQRQADEKRVRTDPVLGTSRIVAFATHGVLSDCADSNEPSLVLTPSGSGQFDGFLTASEVSGLRLNADLVLLSACDTASSDGSVGGVGLSGLTRAFVIAGSRNILATHWQVSSRASLEFTEQLAAHWRSGETLAQSAQAATNSLLSGGASDYFAHPTFWSSFVLIGSGDTLW